MQTPRPLHPLAETQRAQILRRARPLHEEMATVAAITFRASDRSSAFRSRFQPCGKATIVVQLSELRRGRYPKDVRPFVPTYTLRTSRDVVHDTICFGSGVTHEFFNFGRLIGEGGGAHPRRDFAMIKLGLRMDVEREWHTQNGSHLLPAVPVFPRLFLGYSPLNLPPMEDTPALRQHIAAHMGKPVGYVNQLPAEDLRLLMEKVEWPSLFIHPGDQGNDTPHSLLPREFTEHGRDCPVVYEDFQALLGREMQNPLGYLLTQPYNPALAAVAAVGLQDWSQVTDARVAQLLAKMREMLRERGEPDEIYTNDDLINGVVDAQHAQQMSSGKRVPALLRSSRLQPKGDKRKAEEKEEERPLPLKQQLAIMRKQMPHDWVDGCTREDFVQAAAYPTRRLIASQLAKIQFFSIRRMSEASLTFPSTVLQRPGDSAKLWVDRLMPNVIQDAHHGATARS